MASRVAQAAKKIAIAIAAIMLVIAAMWYASKISTFSSLSEVDGKFWLRVSELTLIVAAAVLTLGLIGEWPDSESWKKHCCIRRQNLPSSLAY
jgi:hypothetical protein